MIMEKAYAQLDGNSYHHIEGGWPGEAVELLIGKPPQRLDLSAATPQETQARLQELQNYLNDGHYLTAATRIQIPFEHWPAFVVGNHAYSVQSIDVEKGLIYLQNPWGSSFSPAPLTLEEFNKYFTYVANNAP